MTVVESEAFSEELGDDAADAATSLLAARYLSSIINMLKEGREFKKAYTPHQLEVIESCAEIPRLDELNIIQAFSKMSDINLDVWEERIKIMLAAVESGPEREYDFQTVRILTMFMMLLDGLKPRSKRHLENFLAAVTDGDWMDGMICVSPNGVEFRFVDKASEQARKEFGV